VELDPVTDCIGSVTAFEYVILEGRIEAMETGAALLMGARDGPPITVTCVAQLLPQHVKWRDQPPSNGIPAYG
jgi:hypothetical protein